MSRAKAKLLRASLIQLWAEVAAFTSGTGKGISRRRLSQISVVVLLLTAYSVLAPLPAGAQLGSNCSASLLNRTVPINADGSFAIGNVPANPQSLYRVRVRCIAPNGSIVQGQSAFLNLSG